MKAVILAGGFGTRLRPLTCNIPKPMVPMVNKPIMEHIIRLLVTHGIKDIVAILYYQPETIINYFGNGNKFGVNITYITAFEDLGTAGSVKNAEKYLDKEPFIIISGDVLTDFNLSSIINYHQDINALTTIALTHVDNPLQYGIVITDPDKGSTQSQGSGKIIRFLEKPRWGEVFSDTINTGIYVFSPDIFDYIPAEKEFDFSKNLFPKLLENSLELYGYVTSGYWRDIGNLTEYRLAHYDILSRNINLQVSGKKGNEKIWFGEGVILADDIEFKDGVIIGNNCSIGERVKIVNSCIGNNCIIEEGSIITNSVLWDGVHIEGLCELRENIIGKDVYIKKRSFLGDGSVVSDGCQVGSNCKLRADVKIWPFKTIEDGATLFSSLIWGEKWNRSLFSSHGVLGLANMEITPEFASRLGAAYGATFPQRKRVITSRDAHKSSRMILRAFMSGILSSGVDVWDLGVTPISVARYQSKMLEDVEGLHIKRGSLYDPKLIEIKFFDNKGRDISPYKERAIEQLFYREDYRKAKVEEIGEIFFPYRTIESYKEGFFRTIDIGMIGKNNFKIVIDYGGGTTSTIFPHILGEINCEIISLNAYLDAQKEINTPSKLSQTLKQLSNIVLSMNADIGFLLDQEGEKLFIVDGKGQILNPDVAMILLSKLVTQTISSGTIGVPITATRIIEDICDNRVKRTKTSSRDMMEERDCLMISDGHGGFIFSQFQQAFDSMFAVVKILELLSLTRLKLEDLREEIPDFFVRHERIPCPWESKGIMMRKLTELTKGKKVEFVDGIKFYRDKDWVLFLPDPDEALFHIYGESSSEENTKELMEEYIEKIKKEVGLD